MDGMPRAAVSATSGGDRSRGRLFGAINQASNEGSRLLLCCFSRAQMHSGLGGSEAVSWEGEGRGGDAGTARSSTATGLAGPSLTRLPRAQTGDTGVDPAPGQLSPGDAGIPWEGRPRPSQFRRGPGPSRWEWTEGAASWGRAPTPALGSGGDHPPGLFRGPAQGHALLTHRCQCPRPREQDPAGRTAQKPSRSAGAQRPALASPSQPQRLGRDAVLAPSAGWSSLPALPCAQAPPPYAPPGGLLSPRPRAGQGANTSRAWRELGGWGQAPSLCEVPGPMGAGGERPEPLRGFGLRDGGARAASCPGRRGQGRRKKEDGAQAGELRVPCGGAGAPPGTEGGRGQAAHAAYSPRKGPHCGAAGSPPRGLARLPVGRRSPGPSRWRVALI